MSNEYKVFFGACLPCEKLYRSKKQLNECPRCFGPLSYTIYTEDERERQQYVMNAKRSIINRRSWKSLSPANTLLIVENSKKVEIPSFTFKIKLNYHFLDRTKFVKIEHSSKGILIFVSSENAIEYFNDTDDITQIKIHYKQIGSLWDLVTEREQYDKIRELLNNRDKIIGFIPKANGYSSMDVYISPNIDDYHEMIKNILREDQKRETEARKIREYNEEKLRKEQIAREQKYIAAKQHAYDLHKKKHSGLFSMIFGAPKLRATHCYRCETPLFSSTHKACSICKWLVCSCGACGCQFNKI